MKICIFLLMLFVSIQLNAQEVKHPHSIYYSFIENKGQWNDQVLFKSSFQGGNNSINLYSIFKITAPQKMLI